MSKNRSTKHDTFVQQFFVRISPQVAVTFTDAQLTELKKVFKDRLSKRHAVNIRLSIPFPKKPFFIVLLLGKEDMSKQRLQRLTSTPRTSIFLIRYGLVLITSLFFMLYVVERASGINTFPDKKIQDIVRALRANF